MVANKPAKKCGSCARGCASVPAAWAVTYTKQVRRLNRRTGRAHEAILTIRANVCDDHLYCIEQDGNKVVASRRI